MIIQEGDRYYITGPLLDDDARPIVQMYWDEFERFTRALGLNPDQIMSMEYIPTDGTMASIKATSYNEGVDGKRYLVCDECAATDVTDCRHPDGHVTRFNNDDLLVSVREDVRPLYTLVPSFWRPTKVA